MSKAIDPLCIQFEDQLRDGKSPSVEDFLKRSDPRYRERLLFELLMLESGYQEHDVEQASLEKRFPNDRSLIQSVMDSLVLPKPPELFPGSLVGDYEIIDRIDEGQFSVVYKAKHNKLDRLVAIKSPKFKGSATHETVEDFIDEGKRLARLVHPNILTIYDVVESESSWPLLILEYVDGKPLSTDVPFDDVQLKQFKTVCQALAYAHSEGCVHRDIKPSNIVVDAKGRVVVLDFGLALETVERSSHAGEFAGTLKYMSPEQVRGEAHWLDGRSDVWSLGVILYQMLTQKLPFDGQTPKQIARAIEEQPVQPPRQLNPSIPPYIETLCMKCLAKEASGRFNTAGDLAAALEQKVGRIGGSLPLVAALSGVAVVLIIGAWWASEKVINSQLFAEQRETIEAEQPRAIEQTEIPIVTTAVGESLPEDAELPGHGHAFRPEPKFLLSNTIVLDPLDRQNETFFCGELPQGEEKQVEITLSNPTDQQISFSSVECNEVGDDLSRLSLSAGYPSEFKIEPHQERTFVFTLDTARCGQVMSFVRFRNSAGRSLLTGIVRAYVVAPGERHLQIVDSVLGVESLLSTPSKAYEVVSNHHRSFAGNHIVFPVGEHRMMFDVSPGVYFVAVSWPADQSLSKKANHILRDRNVTHRALCIDQTKPPKDFQDQGHSWKRLGIVRVTETYLQAVFRSLDDEKMIVDAVRLERLSD